MILFCGSFTTRFHNEGAVIGGLLRWGTIKDVYNEYVHRRSTSKP